VDERLFRWQTMVKIFIEGEPPPKKQEPLENAVTNSADLFENTLTLQEAFTRLFEQAGLSRRVHTLVLAGGTTAAAKAFAQAAVKGENVFLLIDTDEDTKVHRVEMTQNKIAVANNNVDKTAFDNRIFFMERECEAWFLYNDVIARWYKTQTSDANLQKNADVNIANVLTTFLKNEKPSETLEPDKVLDKVLKACFQTKRKGIAIQKSYKKVSVCADFLLASKIQDLENRFEDVKRLVERLKK
jgi:hypothetical protein